MKRLPPFASVLAGLAALSSACLESPPSPSDVDQPVVYGNDDRDDVYAHTDQAWAANVVDFTVALMQPQAINAGNPANVRFNAGTLQGQGICADERFANQQTAAFCSGTLIADDLVLTAGHCITNAADCSGTRFVFNYYMDNASTLHTVTSADIYSCAQLVVQRNNTQGGATIDFAIARLDRPATGHTPATVRRQAGALTVGTGLIVNGFPSGLPLKIDDGGAVRDGRSGTQDYFVANLDTFGGNSGSGVFDRTAKDLVGILVRGDTDYVFDNAAGCSRVNTCPENGCGGESSTYGFRAIEALCAAGEPCGCGDGTCDPDESTATCPADCGTSCGDGACNGNETALNCPGDCGTCGNGSCDEAPDTCCQDCGCPNGEMCSGNSCVPEAGAGDSCTNPLTLSANEGINTANGSTAQSNNDYTGSCGGAGPDNVYRFDLNGDSDIVATVSGYDTVLYLRSFCEDAGSQEACNDDVAQNDVSSRIEASLTAGTYYVFVDSYSGGGNYSLSLDVACGSGGDRDSDGTPDCQDGCPDDPGKTSPGACGCGTPDTDSDGDGTADCNDACPDDPDDTCDDPGADGGDDDSGGGCAVSDGAPGGGAAWLVAGVLLLGWRRRRSGIG